MGKIKDGVAIKLIAYVLMIACFGGTVAFGIAAAFNVEKGLYSAGENKAEEIIGSYILDSAANDVSSYIYNEYLAGASASGAKEQLKNAEIIPGEKEAGDFGYMISFFEDGKPVAVKTVNAEILKQYNVEDIIKTENVHEYFEIEMYIRQAGSVKAMEKLSLPTEMKSEVELIAAAYQKRIPIMLGLAGSTLAALALLSFLIITVGSKRNKLWIKRIPLDLTLCAVIIMIMGEGAILAKVTQYIDNTSQEMLAALVTAGVTASIAGTGFLMLLAARVKLGKWWKSTVIYMALRVVFRVSKWITVRVCKSLFMITEVWKMVLLFVICAAVNFIVSVNMYLSSLACLIWFAGALATGAVLTYTSVKLKKLKVAAEHMAEGDFDYKVDEDGMFLDIREHAENLNSISKGMASALEEKMKSERLKTELITNVSHDIKTPLTSIINYVDFLKNEEITEEERSEYIDVLDRQSQRLKKLIEDLIEASKDATGNVKLDMQPCDVGMMMFQVMGEYKEKAESAGLEMIITKPDRPIRIMADGVRMWRVLDNLMNNICKYSQPDTRVYQSLEDRDGEAVITYRNISKYELNISAEELMERFVRGDSSRHTEGSGLGLSIARNLIELQGGIFDIEIDGDLFKVTITFDEI